MDEFHLALKINEENSATNSITLAKEEGVMVMSKKLLQWMMNNFTRLSH